ncbi:MAG TPA: VWA domain-containing protein [Candidatus Acidoferrales bacterium]|nr:VWA domain-containing protein [Candidatus Acidoferrales bacterium]
MRTRISAAIAALAIGLPIFAAPGHRQREKLPKVRELDSGIRWQRDPATGELHALRQAAPGEASTNPQPAEPRAIRSTTQMVAVTCMVSTLSGLPVPGLKRTDFRVYDGGVAQKIAYFDASSQPANVAIVIDASPSVLHDTDQMKQAADALINALAPLDRAAIVDFAFHTYLQLPFTDVRELMRRAVARVNVQELFGDRGGSNIYEAVYLTARELFRGRTGRKAIVLLTDGQDSGMGLTLDPESEHPRPTDLDKLTWDDVVQLLASQDIQVFAVSTQNRPRIMTGHWLDAHRNKTLISPDALTAGIPAYTAFLAELVRQAGGQLYFLNEAPTLADTFRQIAEKIRAEYTVGYYPQLGANATDRAGWHRLRVDLPADPNVAISNRAAYYVPASP